MESNGILPNGTRVVLNIETEIDKNAPSDQAYANRSEELREMLTGIPNSSSHIIPSGIIVGYGGDKNMYNVRWENAISPLPNKEGYLMYPSELTIIPPSQGGGKKARRSRKSANLEKSASLERCISLVVVHVGDVNYFSVVLSCLGIKINNNPKVIINKKICAKQGLNLRILR